MTDTSDILGYIKDLKPCPFCGATDEDYHLTVSHSIDLKGEVRSFMVECDECAAYGPSTFSDAEARYLWNKRAPDRSPEGGDGATGSIEDESAGR